MRCHCDASLDLSFWQSGASFGAEDAGPQRAQIVKLSQNIEAGPF
jgi:hypothetical protein